MSDFGVVVAATETALGVFDLRDAMRVEIEDDPTSGAKSITIDGWVRIAPSKEGWGLYLSSEDELTGESGFELVDSDADPVEIVKSAIVEVISGRTRDVLNGVLDGDS